MSRFTGIEVATAELKNGIYEVNFGYDQNGKAYEGVFYISEAILNWYVEENESMPLADSLHLHTAEQLCEAYLKWHYKANQTTVTLDKQYELTYTVKNADCLCWLLVDEDLNIKEPHTLPIADQHKVRYEAHYNEANRNENLEQIITPKA